MTAEEYEHACQRLEECELQLKYLYADLAETEKNFHDVKKRREKILTRIHVAESNRDCWRRKIACQMP